MELLGRNTIPWNQISISTTGTNWTNVRSTAIAYQTLNGVWRLMADINGTLSSGTTSFDLTIVGITFPYEQAVTVCGKAAGACGFTRGGNGAMNIASTSSTTAWTVHVDCEVLKPYWIE